MEDKALVSVIIPAYNAQQYITRTVNSVLAQTYENMQIIVVDDASTDDTADVLKSFDDPRLELVLLAENGNVCNARNEGLTRVRGDYVAFLDCDDLWKPEKLEKQLDFMENNSSYGACFTWTDIIDENDALRLPEEDEDVAWHYRACRQENRSQAQWLMRLLTEGNCFLCGSVLMRTEIVKQVGMQNVSLLQMQDFEYWLRLLSLCPIYVLCEELVSFRRRRVNTSLSANNPKSYIRGRNEEVFICTHFFDYISDELFSQLFREQFRCKDSITHEELECERAFLLEKAYCAPEPAMARLQQLLGSWETAKLLKEKYGYNQRVFYSENARRRYFDRAFQYRLEDEKRINEQQRHGKDEELRQKNEELRQKNEELRRRENELAAVKQEKNSLNQALYQVQNSRRWRIATMLSSILRFFIPIGSKRALACRLLWTLVRHPVVFLRNLRPTKIKKFFAMLRRGDIEGIGREIKHCTVPNAAQFVTALTPPDVLPLRSGSSVSDYPVVRVPQWQSPQVSVIIPVYNQFEYTYNCVASIVKNSGEVSYELIIANDCSTDLTTQIESILPGVRCVTNEKNLRFLLNCNNAAKYARGEYVLFLNNDTQVMENWLAPLVSLMESNERVGLVGSKLIYPDGRLQEAGGILWKDGSAWNYGHGRNPELPEFNYVKPVDYISGASIMLPRALWEEIGGFDESFAPAYCEDSDLAFTVRKMGYQVLYQPQSVVVHFEGVSNGTDTSTGLKHYQVVNQQKFREKWKDELDRHPENGQNVFCARDRSYGKKTVLVVDHYVPTFDQDAGSRTVFQYLKLFVSRGFNVKFIGDNFQRSEPYTGVLQQMGIEVLYGPEYAYGWEAWIRQNADQIGYAFVNRPHIAPRYIDVLREYTAARIVYYGHDLCFLREMRESELNGDEKLRQSALNWKKKELAVMRKADMAYYPSYVEVEEIHKIDPAIRVKAIPAYLFEDVEWEGYDFDGRRDIMFIGGFNHRPNVDAAVWTAKEILPRLLERLPEVKIHVLGSHPPREVLELQNEHFIVEGFVTDEQLQNFYRRSRISLVPLRYGAGIKGKVIEAMRYGTPVVTTPIGAEGIADAERVTAVRETAEDIAACIASLYTDAGRLTEMSRRSIDYIRENFSNQNAVNVIGPEFDME